MYFYRDSNGNLVPLQQAQNMLLPVGSSAPQPEINWGEVILKSVMFVGGTYSAAKGLEALFTDGQSRRASIPRDTWRYILRDGQACVQFGITNDPEVRCNQHIAAQKQFSTMEIVGPAVSRESARAWEFNRIETYRYRRGRRPKYNKVS